MAEDRFALDGDQLLRAFDFASELSAREMEHRDRMRSLLLDLVNVLHGFDRLWKSFEPIQDVTPEKARHLVESCGVLKRHIEKVLNDAGVSSIQCLGAPLDPKMHSVMETRPTNDIQADTIVEEVSRGFTWHGELLVKALVVVAEPLMADVSGRTATSGSEPDNNSPDRSRGSEPSSR